MQSRLALVAISLRKMCRYQCLQGQEHTCSGVEGQGGDGVVFGRYNPIPLPIAPSLTLSPLKGEEFQVTLAYVREFMCHDTCRLILFFDSHISN